MSKLLVIVGATGTQGRAVVNFFQTREPTWNIRGLTRDPTSSTAVELSSTGVQLVKADLDDIISLRSAFQDANYIYAYTDFGGITKGPRVMGRFLAGEISAPVGKESFNIEVQHGKNIADAASEIPTLERLIWSSGPGVSKLTEGKYSHVYNFDSKAAVMEYMLSLQNLHSKVSGIQLGVFVENFIQGLDLFQIDVEDQTAVWKGWFPADEKLPWVDVQRDLGGYVKALIEHSAPVEVIGVSDWKAPNAWMETWSKRNSFPGHYEEMPRDAPVTEDPTGFKLFIRQVAQFVTEFGYTGNARNVLAPEDLIKSGLQLHLTPVEDYISRADWSGIIG